jgi:nucleotide-binding universal stress UspA family protein
MMAQDGEMPQPFARLNRHGVPLIPLIVAVAIPVVILIISREFEALAGLYAIGVVGAIAVNLGSCTFNKHLALYPWERLIMGATFFVLAAVEITLAKTKPDALFFAVCVLFVGLVFRAYSHKVSGLKTVTVARKVAEMVTPDLGSRMDTRLQEGQKIMVAARGITRVLSFALDEAELRKATLCVLYVKEIAVYYSGAPAVQGRPKWQDDPEANAIMSLMLKLGAERNICVLPVYVVSEDTATTILDLSATMGVDFLVIGASQRTALAKLLRGSVATNVAQQLPDSIQLLIFG